MDDFDKADLDGDGEFDAIDLMILDKEEGEELLPASQKAGCCVFLIILGSGLLGTAFLIDRFIV